MSEMRSELIAPCGMNCRLCMAYQRDKKHCDGCRQGPKSWSCQNCRIKNCPELQKTAIGFCFNCAQFPCKRLTRLDSRYRGKYHMSEIDNLEYIRNSGMDAFLEYEEARWTCGNCGNIVCVHHQACPVCKAQVPQCSDAPLH